MSDAEARQGHRDETDRAGHRHVTRWAVTIVAALLALGMAMSPALAPRAQAAPLGKYGGTLSFTLAGVDPVVVTSSGSRTVSVTGSYTNTSKYRITDLGYKFQRGKAMSSTAAIRKEAADPTQQFAVVDSGFHNLPGPLKAGASATFTATVRLTGNKKRTLAITKPGVYPIMININATVHLPDGKIRARVGELHLMLTVLSVPGHSDHQVPGTPSTSGIPFNLLWPVVDRPHLGVNGVFTDDDLAHEIAPGGRLTNLVDALSSSRAGPDAITLVIDPMLLDELDRMSHGYWVVARPGTPQPALTPTSRTQPTTPTSAPPSISASTSTSTSTSAPSSGPSSASSAPAGVSSGSNAAVTGSTGPADSTSSAASTGGSAGTAGGGATASGSGVSTTGTAGTSTPSTPSGPTDATSTLPPATSAPGAIGSSSAGPSTATSTSGTSSSTGTTPAPTTSTPNPGPRPKHTVPGTGSAAAAAFLDRLRALAQSYRVLVLPYGDPDLVALVRAGMTDDLAAAVYRGRAVAARVLEQPVPTAEDSTHLVTTVVDPIGGVLNSATLRAMTDLGYDSAVLAADGVTGTPSPQGAVPVALGAQSVPALVSDASLASDIGDYVYSGVPSNAASQVNLLAALLAQQHTDGTGTPMLLTPGRDWSPNRAGISFITTLLEVMDNEGVVTGTPLTSIAGTVAGQHPQGKLHYPRTARDKELPGGYLSVLQQLDYRIGVLQEALTADPNPGGGDPADILTPLQEALLPAASASLRGVAEPEQPVLTTISASLNRLFNGVRIHRSSASFTLASSTSPLLLTVQNTLPYQVSVGVSILGGGRSGLITHDPGVIDIPAGPRTKPVKISAEVSRSGTFTVYAQLHGPDGATWGSAVPLTIASRAYGALTLVLMLVAGGVLVLMVAFRIHQRWRGRQTRLAAVTTATGDEGVTAVTDQGTGGDERSHRNGGDETDGNGGDGESRGAGPP